MAITSGNGKEDSDDIVAEINMTPLIDIMLVLLIIFMVTSSIALESGLDIQLPQATSQSDGELGQVVIVSLDSKGNLSVQGRKVELAQLGEEIKRSLEDEKTDQVIFEGDQLATLGRAIEVMDIAKASGAKKFAIATDSKKN